MNEAIKTIIGDFDNFQQYWQENTEEALHRATTEVSHRHLHVKVCEVDTAENLFVFQVYEGRNNETYLGDIEVNLSLDNVNISENGFSTKDGIIALEGDQLDIHQLQLIDETKEEPYRLLRCRYFNGWFRYPTPTDEDPEKMYYQQGLVIHDQGGMASLDIEGVDYTAELTQLVYAKTLKIMKLAVLDLPIDQVGINTRSISYTWAEPDATRLGINIRKILTGWAMAPPIEL